MKKRFLLFFMFIFAFALTSCDFESIINGIQGGNSQNESSGSESFKKGALPLYSEETIRKNIGAYSHEFKITTYDGIYYFNARFDNETSTGIVTRQNFTVNNEKTNELTDYFFLMGKQNECVSYYENDFGYGYEIDYNLNLLYLTYLYDISRDVVSDAPYASKTELTYAKRNATKYVISNSNYIIPGDTKLYIILDNETGAVLSLTYDHINFYESTSFTPNSQEAKTEVLAKKDSLAFDFFEIDALKLVGLENISIPDWYYCSATFMYMDESSKDISNMYSYSAQYYEVLKNTTPIDDLCKYIYNQGVKYDNYGNEEDFDELYNESYTVIDYTGIHTVGIDAYITINDVKYNVVFNGTNKGGSDTWYISLIITVVE